jgi:hypothetical protein
MSIYLRHWKKRRSALFQSHPHRRLQHEPDRHHRARCRATVRSTAYSPITGCIGVATKFAVPAGALAAYGAQIGKFIEGVNHWTIV